MASKSKAELAREHLERALPEVSVGNLTEAVTWLFVALEAAIAALAAANDIPIEPKHWLKAEVGTELSKRGVVKADLGELARVLNDARKEALYEGEEPELGAWSLGDISTAVEAAVKAAEGGGAS